MDGARIQLDYILADGHVTVQQVWHDYIVPIGLDHRCAHCILQWSGTRPPPKHRGINLKNWAPKLDENGTPTSFCNYLMEQLTRIQDVSFFNTLEKCLVQAGKLHGTYGSKKLVFRPSEDLLRLRRRRRTASDLVERKQLSFQIRKLHRQELRTWRSASLRLCLNNSSSWNLMRGMLQPTGRHVVEQPHPNDFADMLEDIFSGNFGRPMDRPMLTEAPWSMNELRVAIRRAKSNRTGDDLGWLPNCWNMRRKVIWKLCWMYFVMLSVPVKSPHHGKQQSSRCFQNPALRNLHQIFVPLLACVCCTKFSPTSCWVGWGMR